MSSKILVVDDEQDMLDLISYNLTAQGYEVQTAETGVRAVECARRFRPDLIVLDLMLPELDGFSVCEILRSQASTCGTPVLAITAYGGEMPRINALAAGATEFLAKPFSPQALLQRISRLLGR